MREEEENPSLQVTTEAAKTAWEGTKSAWEKAAPLREKVADNEVVQQGVAQVKEGWRSLVSWVNPGAGAAGRPVPATGAENIINVQPAGATTTEAAAEVAGGGAAGGNLIPTSEESPAAVGGAGAAGSMDDQGKPAELSA